MRAALHYAKEEIQFEVPDEKLAWVIDRKASPPLQNPRESLRGALKAPIKSPPLEKIAERVSRVLILVDDITRQTPQDIIIPVLLNELNDAGVSDQEIELMIALGTHRKMTEIEIENKLGKAVTQRVSVHNFDCHNRQDLVKIGTMLTGADILVSRKVVSADLVIGVGNIVPHCYAGWAGGGKIIMPGVCGTATIGATHIAAGMIRPISSIIGTLENPIRKMIDEIALKAGLRFVVNTILNQDDEISGVFAGHPIEAFRTGVEHAKETYCPTIDALADIVVASSYPADLDYWQAAKPADHACLGIKEGGTLILVAPCPEGVSRVHPELKTFGRLTYDEVLDKHRRKEIRDRVAVAALLLHSQMREHVEVACLSHGLTREDKEALGFSHAASVQEAVDQAVSKMGEEARIGVMKCGDIMPVLTR